MAGRDATTSTGLTTDVDEPIVEELNVHAPTMTIDEKRVELRDPICVDSPLNTSECTELSMLLDHVQVEDTVEVNTDQLQVRRIVNPRAFRGNIPSDAFRMVRASATSVSASASAPVSPHPPQPRHSRTLSMYEPSDVKTPASSVVTTAVTLNDFVFHDNDLPPMSSDQLEKLFSEMQTFLQKFTTLTDLKDMDREFMKFRTTITHQTQLPYTSYATDINIEYEQIMFILQRFTIAFHDVGLIRGHDAEQDRQMTFKNRCRLAQAFEILCNVRTMLVSHKRNEYLADVSKPYTLGEWQDQINPGYFTMYRDDIKLSTNQKLLIYVLDKAAEHKYRKQWRDYPGVGDTVALYEQIRTPEGHATHAWKRCTHLDEFVNRICNFQTNYDQTQ